MGMLDWFKSMVHGDNKPTASAAEPTPHFRAVCRTWCSGDWLRQGSVAAKGGSGYHPRCPRRQDAPGRTASQSRRLPPPAFRTREVSTCQSVDAR